MNSPGTQLEQLCRSGRRDVLLVAPFIKTGALTRLLAHVPDTASVRCVTRWRPEEIIAGVSDLEIWPLLRDRPRASLWLRANLHAKFYRADNQCLVGSANLTDTALGWAPRPNLELLVALSAHDPAARVFEEELFRECLPVDEGIFQQMSNVVALLEQNIMQQPLVIYDTPGPTYQTDKGSISDSMWLPTLRNPADLYLTYAQHDDDLISTARSAAETDLYGLAIPWGLPRSAFEAYVGVLLLQKPVIQQVDAFLVHPRRFGAVRDLLATLPCAKTADFDPTYAWQTLMRWLLYFLPRRYTRVPSRHSEVLVRTTGA